MKHVVRSILALLCVVAAPPAGASQERIAHLVQMLDAPEASYKVKLLTMAYLGRFRARQAVPSLVRLLLSSRCQAVRRMAVTTLGHIGDRGALPALDAVRRHNRFGLAASARRAIAAIRRATRRRESKQVYLALGRFTNRARQGGPALAELLRSSLEQSMRREPSVATATAGVRPTATELEQRELRGYTVDGSIVRIRRERSGTRQQLTCQIRLSVATYPGGSMRAFYHGEASVDAPAWQAAGMLYRDAIEGAAQQATQQILSGYINRAPRSAL